MEERAPAYGTLDTQPDHAQLIACMRQTAAWPSVQQLRAWTRASLQVPAGGSLLDVGCGLADVLIGVGRERTDPVQLVGIDASSRMLVQARHDAAAAGVDLDLCRADARRLPFPEARFGAVRSERTLQWVDDPAAAVAEMVRVVRPGGSLVLIDTDWRTAAFDLGDPQLEELLARVVASGPSGDVGGRVRRLAADAGLQAVRVRGATAVITDWDPDERDAAPGFVPAERIAHLLVEVEGLSAREAHARAGDLVAAARRGHFQLTVSMLAVTGTRPGPGSDRQGRQT